ncbi:MAG TPA: hypothetical protein VNL16_08690 [Chloroflexota bacterium]|nr:hypothetical protein [Chloroflexota bacterium]
MPDTRFGAFRDTLNRTINKTVSRDRLTVVPHTVDPTRAVIVAVVQGSHQVFRAIRLGNGHYLSVRMDVHLIPDGVSTDANSIAYRQSEETRGDDWIFRYEYERLQAESGTYPYPVAHWHVNATPAAYAGARPFPELHLPTGRLSLEDIIRHLIVEHAVPTLCPRADALAFLDEQRNTFQHRRTDPGRPASVAEA